MRFLQALSFAVVLAVASATTLTTSTSASTTVVSGPASTETFPVFKYTEETKDVLDTIRGLKKDPSGRGISHIGDDGVIRTYDQHGTVLDYAQLDASQLDAYISNLPPLLQPHEAHLREVYTNVSGHDVQAFAQIMTPPDHLRPLWGPGSRGRQDQKPAQEMAKEVEKRLTGCMYDVGRRDTSVNEARGVVGRMNGPPPVPPCFYYCCGDDFHCRALPVEDTDDNDAESEIQNPPRPGLKQNARRHCSGTVILPKRINTNLPTPPHTPRPRGRPVKRLTSSKRAGAKKPPAVRKPLTPTTKTAILKARRHRAYLRKWQIEAMETAVLRRPGTYLRVLRDGKTYRSLGGTSAS
ncbi:hypothetical protein LTR62_007366 [Meristemomyces frigidus]|uniref:Uncharacterized protein n=1 Tax=Meristemomyces frigidus TaxID=1508187 RepID=A0AAN7TPV7_9PEZI|nr:hypothetical protein LTR62_007366 [Meristemomyces frigidus]